MINSILHAAAEIFFISVGIFAVWAIHATITEK
jgi:hypothetical protein